jgi:D-arabinose 1-dehydrogenase-like Zn-dependent alcohol dehydrogenase
MEKMKAVQVPKAGADFEMVEREIPQPGAEHVRIHVQACGICHRDVITKEGLFPGITYARVPGHEVAGMIDEVGAGVKEWQKGQRVGVGWHGGQDGTCLACRRGDFVNCANVKICGISYDGGYQEYMVAPVEALAQMTESLDPAEAVPLMCAGVTTFNSLYVFLTPFERTAPILAVRPASRRPIHQSTHFHRAPWRRHSRSVPSRLPFSDWLVTAGAFLGTHPVDTT